MIMNERSRVAWTDEAWEEFEYWTEQDKKTLRQIKKLLKDIDRNGYKGLGHPEPLTGDLSGYWSRHIDEKNRIVFYTCSKCTNPPYLW